MGSQKDKTADMDALAEHVGHVRRRIAQLVRGHAAVEDCVQETLLEACRSVDKHGPPQHPKAWLATIAERVAYKHTGAHRSRTAREALVQQEHSTPGSVLDIVVHADDVTRLHHAISSLPDRDRSIIDSYYWRGMTCPDIGRDAGNSAAAIKSRLHRCRAELLTRLGAEAKERSR